MINFENSEYFNFMETFQSENRQVRVGVVDPCFMTCLDKNFEAQCCNYGCRLKTELKSEVNSIINGNSNCAFCPAPSTKSCCTKPE